MLEVVPITLFSRLSSSSSLMDSSSSERADSLSKIS